MPELIYPTKREFRGPWLIDSKSLEELDKVLNKITEYLGHYINEKIKQETNQEIKEIYNGTLEKYDEVERTKRELYVLKRSITIQIKGDKSIIFNSFEDAKKEQLLNEEAPSCFQVEIEYNYSNKIELSIGNYNRNTLEFKVDCEDLKIQNDCFYLLNQWVHSIKPSPIIKIWSEINFFGGWFLGTVILFQLFILLLSPSTPSSSDIYREQIKEEVNAILTEGINEKNSPRAIEIILSLQTRQYPNIETTKNSFAKFLPYLLISISLCIILSFPPKSYIGLGRGEIKIKRWRSYINFLLFFIPIHMLFPLILNFIGRYLYWY